MNKRLLIAILIVVFILLIPILVIFLTKTENKDVDESNYFDSLSPHQKSIISGNINNFDNVYLDNSGIKINSSENLKKEISIDKDLLVKDIILYSNSGKSCFIMNIVNNNNFIIPKFTVKVSLLDNEKNIIYSFKKSIDPVKSYSTTMVEHIVEQDISNAYDITIEKES